MSAPKKRLLITAYDYRPRLGGVSTCGFNLSHALARQPELEVKVIAPALPPASEWRDPTDLLTDRVRVPAHATLAVPALRRALKAQMQTWKPDAILHLNWYPQAIASLGLPIPKFILAHGMELLESRKLRRSYTRLLRPFKKSAFREVTHAFAVSEFTRQLIVEQAGLAPGRTSVVHNGVDLQTFHPIVVPRAWAGQDLTGCFVLVTVCRLEPYKGIDQTLRAVAALRKRAPELRYLVGGTGPDLPRLQRLADELGINEQVTFLGAVPDAELPKLYSVSDLNVLLSRQDLRAPEVEGFGLVFLEAAACGRASIGGRSGGIGDAIREGETGWLVDPNSEFELVAQLEKLIHAPQTVRSMGERARMRACDELSWSQMADKIAEGILTHVRV